MRALVHNMKLESFLSLHCLLGFGAAFIAGMGIIRFAITYLEKGNMKGFGWYCIALGLATNLYMLIRL